MTADGAYRVSSGTSMAAPLVAGAVALYLERFPGPTPRDVARAIASTSTAVSVEHLTGKKEKMTKKKKNTEGTVRGDVENKMINLEAMLDVHPGA